MGTTTHQIEDHIERTRDALCSNLNELEQKVKSVADWQQHVRNRPGTSLALAFGGGVVLAAILGGRSKRSAKQRSSRPATAAEPLLKTARRSGAGVEAWDRVKGVVIGVAAARLANYVEDVFPGFRKKREHIHEEAVVAEPGARSPQPSEL
jgi:hypothetical protein